MPTIKYSLFNITSVVLTIMLSAGLVGAEDTANWQRGPAFADPDDLLQKLPPDWKNKPVQYSPKDKGADLVVVLDQQSYLALVNSIDEYAKDHNLKINVHEGTCGISQGRLLRKEADIGGYCCPPGRLDRLPGLRFHTTGIAPVAVITHPDNPVDRITEEEARAIFAGLVTRWGEVEDERSRSINQSRIQPIARLHCAVRPGHWRLLLDNEDLFGPVIQEVGAIPDMLSRVARDQHAIGFAVLSMIHHYRDQYPVKTLKIDGHAPSDMNYLLDAKYPMYRTYSLTTWDTPNIASTTSRELVEYLLQQVEKLSPKINIIPSSQLKQTGWRFKEDELIGEPK